GKEKGGATQREVSDAQQAQRNNGFGGAPLPQHKAGPQNRGRHGQARDLQRAPGKDVSTPNQCQEQAGDGAGEQGGARIVDSMPALHVGYMEKQRRHGNGQRPYWQIYIKDPAPTDTVDQKSAGERPGNAGQCENGLDVPLVSAALAR